MVEARACFCLSKGRDARAADSRERLRPELEALKPSALKRRAKAGGAGSVDVKGALDAEDPKAAMIDLVLLLEEQQQQPDEDPVAGLPRRVGHRRQPQPHKYPRRQPRPSKQRHPHCLNTRQCAQHPEPKNTHSHAHSLQRCAVL